ncbi:MAG: sigma-70 family RNA polymerase sigma factor [Chthoniobacterales bacterium]|jgi:RNA polymerase sigma factor (sigma-70 family)
MPWHQNPCAFCSQIKGIACFPYLTVSASTPEQLFESHLDLALKIARSISIIGHNVDEREQEARIALWNAANAFDPARGNFEPFASTVIRNRLLNTLSKAARRAEVESLILDAPVSHESVEGESRKETTIPSPEASPLLEAERNDIRVILREGMSSLTPGQQEVLQSYAEGNKYAEIAREKGVSKAAVRQMVQRAVEQTRPEVRTRGVMSAKFLPGNPENYAGHDLPLPSRSRPSWDDRIKNFIGIVFLLWLIYMAFPVLKENFFP